MGAVTLADLAGLWRRTLITWPDGRSNAATDVFWLQGPRFVADLRIPPGRPDRGTASCLRQFDWDMLRFLARQEGFIGHLDVTNAIGHWHRSFDYQPDNGISDRGSLEFAGGILIERGIDLPYIEHWARQSPQSEPVMALALTTEAALPIGCLIASGTSFIYARSRVSPLPRNTTLQQLVAESDSIEAAQDLFDCEISFGRIRGDRWQIERSSLPFREGHFLAPTVDPALSTLVIDDIARGGVAIKRAWHISRYEGDEPFRHWFGTAQ